MQRNKSPHNNNDCVIKSDIHVYLQMNHQTSASNEVHETTEAIPDTDSLSSSDSESSSDSSDSEESSESGCDEWPEIDRKQLLEDLRREHSDLTVLEKTRREGESDRKSPYYKQDRKSVV